MDAVVLSREFGISIYRLLTPYIPYLWRIALIGCGGFLLGRSWGSPDVVHLAAVTSLVSLAYGLLFFGLVRRGPLAGHLKSALAMLREAMSRRMPRWARERA